MCELQKLPLYKLHATDQSKGHQQKRVQAIWQAWDLDCYKKINVAGSILAMHNLL
jgi:hypothetical protein